MFSIASLAPGRLLFFGLLDLQHLLHDLLLFHQEGSYDSEETRTKNTRVGIKTQRTEKTGKKWRELRTNLSRTALPDRTPP